MRVDYATRKRLRVGAITRYCGSILVLGMLLTCAITHAQKQPSSSKYLQAVVSGIPGTRPNPRDPDAFESDPHYIEVNVTIGNNLPKDKSAYTLAFSLGMRWEMRSGNDTTVLYESDPVELDYRQLTVKGHQRHEFRYSVNFIQDHIRAVQRIWGAAYQHAYLTLDIRAWLLKDGKRIAFLYNTNGPYIWDREVGPLNWWFGLPRR